MTAKELHTQKIIPLRVELSRLEKEYENLYRKECAEKIGVKRVDCSNCAYSCIIHVTDHNQCMGDNCTCCHDWCYRWIPENKVSAYLRQYHPYDSEIYYRLENTFGDDLLKCDNIELLMETLELIDKIDNHIKENNNE